MMEQHHDDTAVSTEKKTADLSGFQKRKSKTFTQKAATCEGVDAGADGN